MSAVDVVVRVSELGSASWHFIEEETKLGTLRYFLKTSCPGDGSPEVESHHEGDLESPGPAR